MTRRLLAILTLVLFSLHAFAQSDDQQIEAQKRAIKSLEQQIAAGERELSTLKKDRSASESRVKRLVRQLEARNQLLNTSKKQVRLLQGEISRKDRTAAELESELQRNRTEYADMVREAYRNYKHNNYITYIFASRDFADMARKIANLRAVAALRERKMEHIAQLAQKVAEEKQTLAERKQSLDTQMNSLAAQKKKLQGDTNSARASLKSMSRKEKAALQRKLSQEQQLSVAISELRKLTKGNTEGTSFSTKTTGLHLPVEGGRVKRYKENMAEVVGPAGAQVISIYDGKVVDVKRNRITDKYDVFVAHGDYITSYANLGTISVEKGQKVAKNASLGTIGASMNITTMQPEYKIVFGIYPPNPGQRMLAENCFRK